MPFSGFSNPVGAQNCFLNAVLQVLWHSRVFREHVLHDRAHACAGAALCVVCALRSVFRDLVGREVGCPDRLRSVLARVAPAFPTGMCVRLLGDWIIRRCDRKTRCSRSRACAQGALAMRTKHSPQF